MYRKRMYLNYRKKWYRDLRRNRRVPKKRFYLRKKTRRMVFARHQRKKNTIVIIYPLKIFLYIVQKLIQLIRLLVLKMLNVSEMGKKCILQIVNGVKLITSYYWYGFIIFYNNGNFPWILAHIKKDILVFISTDLLEWEPKDRRR